VVDVGLTLVDPLANVEVKVPGVMAIVVAPLVAQLSMALVPEFMVAGLAPNDEMAGTEPCGCFPELLTLAQPLRPIEARRRKENPNRFNQPRRTLRESAPCRPKSAPQKSAECIRDLLLALVAIARKCNDLRCAITTGHKGNERA
jgi:hypothetical protein